MSKKVKAAVLSGPGKIDIREFPYPAIKDDDFIMKMEIAGICGTDKHSYKGEMKLYAGTEIESDFQYPVIPGHENVGTVFEIGKKPRKDFYGEDLHIGDRIYMWPDVICGNCLYCRDAVNYGFPFCENKHSYGVTITCQNPPHLFGGWAEYMYITSDVFVYKIPDGMSLEKAVLPEFMSVFYDLDKVGDTVVVQGVGTLGLCQVIKARILGAGTIIAIDRSKYKLKLAKEFGADYTINIDEMEEKDRIKKVKDLTHGHGADMVVECAGVPQAIIEGIEMMRRGGQYIEMGSYVEMGTIPLNPHRHLCAKSIRLRGISNHPYLAVGPALKLIERYSNTINFEKIISHKFKLEDVKAAVEKSMEPDSMKVVIMP